MLKPLNSYVKSIQKQRPLFLRPLFLLAVRPERIEIGDEAKNRRNHFSVKVQNILYKGTSLEYLCDSGE